MNSEFDSMLSALDRALKSDHIRILHQYSEKGVVDSIANSRLEVEVIAREHIGLTGEISEDDLASIEQVYLEEELPNFWDAQDTNLGQLIEKILPKVPPDFGRDSVLRATQELIHSWEVRLDPEGNPDPKLVRYGGKRLDILRERLKLLSCGI